MTIIAAQTPKVKTSTPVFFAVAMFASLISQRKHSKLVISYLYVYARLRRGQLHLIVHSRFPLLLCLFNPWAAYAKAAAHGALGHVDQAKRYSLMLNAMLPFPFLKKRLAKYLGRTQPSLVRELLGPVGPGNPLRIAFELVSEVSSGSLGLGNYQPTDSAYGVLWYNRLASTATARVPSVNQLLHKHGSSTVQWAPAQPFQLEFVVQSAKASPIRQAKVSVLVTAYNCGQWVRQSVQSLLAQTHHNLQILVANDSSTDDTWKQLSALVGSDSRLMVFNLPHNVGTYAAKSLLLNYAVGDYVVCHDADDLADPTFIAQSLAALQADASKVAVISNWFRVDEDLRIFPGAVRRFWPLLSINHSSLMLRTELLRQIGGWDVPRVAADTELFERVRAIYGERAVVQLRGPLTIGSLRSDSLMNDAHVGAMRAEAFRRRVEYREAWVQWHQQCKKQGIKPTMASPFASDRPFAVPAEFKVDPEVIARCFAAIQVVAPLPKLSVAGQKLLCSAAIRQQYTLAAMLGAQLVSDIPAQAVLAWGRKPSAQRAERLAHKRRLPVIRVEDGFLRSFGIGEYFPGLSVVVDSQGIYYDSTRPSDLENSIAGNKNLLADPATVDAALEMLLQHRLSKYNHAPDVLLDSLVCARSDCDAGVVGGNGRLGGVDTSQNVLVLDQTFGDMSVRYGAATQQTFNQMLQAAIDENPGTQIWVKTHPEVFSGRKRGYLDHVKAMALPQGGQLRLLRGPANPISLLQQVGRVYVATSGMGFEALLCGKPVRCFGLPWYAGWGVTQDEQHCSRRTRSRTVRELFAAAYLHYSRYLNPTTHRPGSILDVMAWLVRQRQIAGLV